MSKVAVKSDLISWARERSGLTINALVKRFPKFRDWERGEAITLRQLEALAKTTSTPLGYFFLPKPPEEKLPIPDFRTVRDEPFQFLARHFKVSPLVAARRALDLRLLNRPEFFEFYRKYQEDERRQKRKSSGGDFYATQGTRVGERFANAVIRAVKEGRLLYRDAYRFTGLHSKTFDRYADSLGFRM